MSSGNYEIIRRAPRAVRTIGGDTVTVYAGGRHVYLPSKVKARAGITNRVTIYYDKQAKILRFVAATERTFRQSYGCRTGMCGATVFPKIFGYVPETTWIPVTVHDGREILLPLYNLYRDAPVIDYRQPQLAPEEPEEPEAAQEEAS